MSVYMTEEEQVELIKSWWKKYSGIIIVSLSILLLVLSAVRYWHWHQENKIKQASNTYERMMLAFSNSDYKSVKSYSRQLIDDYNKTVYADSARLILAKIAINHEKYGYAKNLLAIVAKNSKSNLMMDIARIRLSRILIEEKAYDEALLQLNGISNSPYFPMVDELKGDIYTAMGKNFDAAKHYQEAINAVEKNGVGNLFLEMKSSELLAEVNSNNAIS